MLLTPLIAACVSSPLKSYDNAVVPAVGKAGKQQRNDATAAKSREVVRLKVSSTLPLRQSDNYSDALLASNLSFGIEKLLSYQASYLLQPGDFTAGDTVRSKAPIRFGGQVIGQNMELQLSEFAGSPLSLGLSTEYGNNWMTSGYTQFQREQAHLNWSAGPAAVSVQWAGSAMVFDAAVALTCDLDSTIRLRTHQGTDHSEALRLSGRDCVIAAEDTPYAGVEARNWGLGYVWSRPARQTEAILSMINPVWTHGVDSYQIDPSYELGLRHRRTFGTLSANTSVSLRRSSVRDLSSPIDLADRYASVHDTNWTADAALVWDLPRASVSTTWAKGVDRLWFTPDIGRHSDRFGLALNLSRWLDSFVPHSSPQLAMSWNWSQIRLRDDEITNNNSLRIDMALMF